MTKTTTYDWWYAACAAAKLGEKLPKITEEPECGYYRMRRVNNGPWLPVAIFAQGSEVLALVGFGDDGEHDSNVTSVWMSACMHPVSYAAYNAAYTTGVWWSDVLSDEAPAQDAQPTTQPGSNSQAMGVDAIERTPQEEAEKSVADAIYAANIFSLRIGALELSRQTDADEAANIVQCIKAAVNDAAKVHKKLKEPHLRSGQELDAWLREVKADADKASQKLTAKITAYLIAERKRKEEELRKTQEEAKAKAEAERKRLEAERAAQIAAERAANPETTVIEQAPPPIVVATEPVKAPEPVKVGGGNGTRSIGLQTKTRVLIEDYAKALEAAANEPEVRDAVQEVANRLLKANIVLTGCRKEEYQEARR